MLPNIIIQLAQRAGRGGSDSFAGGGGDVSPGCCKRHYRAICGIVNSRGMVPNLPVGLQLNKWS